MTEQEIVDKIGELSAVYWKKFGVDYEFDMGNSMKNAEVLADLKDCIENNHLQVNKPLEDYDPNLEY